MISALCGWRIDPEGRELSCASAGVGKLLVGLREGALWGGIRNVTNIARIVIIKCGVCAGHHVIDDRYDGRWLGPCWLASMGISICFTRSF